MTLRKLASLIALKEGKKSQITIGNAREVLSILSDVVYEQGPDVLLDLWTNGKNRAKKKKNEK